MINDHRRPYLQKPWRLSLALGVALGLGLTIMMLLQSVAAEPVHAPFVRSGLSDVNYAGYPNCRFGVGGVISSAYAITPLNLGWYMDWGARLTPNHPNGAEYVQVIRVKPDAIHVYTFTPSLATIYQIADQNPGTVWLIGNEPDSPYQDRLLPETYAQAYHDLYYWIKQHDTAAKIGAGSIVQPTALRMQYLDRVLSTYRANYSETLPADLWSIHSYILREIDPSDPEAQPAGPYEVWGAFIPPGFLPQLTRGVLYTYSDTFDTTLFRQRLSDFRKWMRDRGYQQTPLYITEYGTLFPYPPFIGFTYLDEFNVPMNEARTAAFMTKTFDVLQTLTDTSLGYSADGGQLVQRWLWYSVDDQSYGGALFNSGTGQRTGLGDVFANYMQMITPTSDLFAAQAHGDTTMMPVAQETVTGTVWGQISNIGNIATDRSFTVTFYEGPSGQMSVPLGQSVSVTQSLKGCADSIVFTTTWPELTVGAHKFHLTVETEEPEPNLDNNQVEGVLLVADRQVWLPVIMRMGP